MSITVLLASYKGEAYLPAQLESIVNQQDVDCRVLISDDVSAERCRAFIQAQPTLQPHLSHIRVIDGPHHGVNPNFLHLIHHAQAQNSTDCFAYSDQDDQWVLNKLSSAHQQLKALSPATPTLYAARTTVCDAELKPLFLSKGMPQAASFKNALLESIAGGNTMLFNQASLQLLQKIQHPIHHDWLTYMVVTACGGEVVFDDTPYVWYRQHGNNLIGANNGIKAKLHRLIKLLGNEFHGWADNNIVALSAIRADMTPENQQVFDGFVTLHTLKGWQHGFKRLALFNQLGLYRQRRLEHYGFMLAAFLGKL